MSNNSNNDTEVSDNTSDIADNQRQRRMPMEECLFGPSRVCPPDVWDAVMGGGDATWRHRLNSARRMKIDDDLLLEDRDVASVEKHTIQLQELRRLASQGMEDDDFRAVAWRVSLGVLPLDTSTWKDTLVEKRTQYRSLVSDVFMEPQLSNGNELRGNHGKRKSAQASRKYHLDLQHSSSPSKVAIKSNNKSGEANEKILQQNEDDDGNKSQQQQKERKLKEESQSSLSSLEQQQSPPPNRSSENPKEEELTLKTSAGTVEENNGDMVESLKDPDDNKEMTINLKNSFDSLADIVPTHIQEEWKKNGRDIQDLDCMSGSSALENGMNTLLVTDQNFSSKKPSEASNDDTKWFQFFENASLLDEIRKDVVRTHPDLYFFLEPENNLGKRRYAALERILFVWAGLNKGVRYVQGMNEIVGTIYYVLANDENDEWACEAEADTYFLFNTLMIEMRDIFVPDLDEADTGIQGRISNMTALLSLHDPEVRCHLVDIGIDPAYFAIRWLTTLLSREFLLPDTIRLWDSMFASTHKDNFMRYVCATMVMIIRQKLLKGDFSTCLRLLQSYPSTNIDGLLEASRALWIYESQVTLACHKGGISLHQALCTITPPPSIVMAYGLPGGVVQTRRGEESSSSSGTSRTKNSGGGFFSRANAVLGQIGEATRSTRSRAGFR